MGQSEKGLSVFAFMSRPLCHAHARELVHQGRGDRDQPLVFSD
jgi:hypothetical protein